MSDLMALELWIGAGALATLLMICDIFWNLDADDRRGFNTSDVIAFGLLSVFLGPITLAIALVMTLFNARYWLTCAGAEAAGR